MSALDFFGSSAWGCAGMVVGMEMLADNAFLIGIRRG